RDFHVTGVQTCALPISKKAGRWHIDRASLLRRIELDPRIRKERKVELTVENLVAVGGREWKRGDKHRVYFNNISDYLPIEIEHRSEERRVGKECRSRWP